MSHSSTTMSHSVAMITVNGKQKPCGGCPLSGAGGGPPLVEWYAGGGVVLSIVCGHYIRK